MNLFSVRTVAYVAIAFLASTCDSPLAAQTPSPCAQDATFAQQDFTLGHWDVFDSGKKTAEVLMEKALRDCAIRETWIAPGRDSGNGLGLFTYLRTHKRWGYFWAADSGSASSWFGSLLKPGTMRYEMEIPFPDGGKRLRHWSLILQPDGTVRELSVASTDAGKTWTTEYDLLWRKKS